MRVYLRARGQDRVGGEFIFLGRAPERQWWREHRHYFEAESPTVLVVSDGATWRVMLAGVPTALRDVSDRAPTYTVVLDGAAGDPDAALALRLVDAFLAELGEVADSPRAGAVIDAQLPPEVIERLRAWTLRDGRQDEAVGEVADRVCQALATLPAPATAGSAPAPASWVSLITDATARAAALHRAATLFAGTAGIVAYLNLPTQAAVVRPLTATAGGAAVLLQSEAALPSGLVDLDPPPAPERPTGPKALAGAAPARRPTVLEITTAAALVALAVMILLMIF
ncbi:MAG TPA: hypothetical protein VFB84_05175 [Micromonosporaceae bacterium]|nr:hypothetical protein [Micromonosporaceae bacterium]